MAAKQWSGSRLQDTEVVAQEVKSCIIKQRHPTPEAAQKACRRALMVYGTVQQPYHCQWCGDYHNATVERRRF